MLARTWRDATDGGAAVPAEETADTEFVGAASVEYLMYSGYVSLAHHWLKMEVAAETALTTGILSD